jgi:hypothetical protein
MDRLKDLFRGLTGSLSRVGRLPQRKGFLPALRELLRDATSELGTLVLELALVLLEQIVPLLLSSCALRGVLVVHIVDLLGHNEGLLGVETKLLLDVLGIISLQGIAVNTAGSLQLRAEADGCGEFDDRGLVSDFLSLLDSSLDAVQIIVAVLDVLSVPAVCLEALEDVFGEGDLGVAVWLQVS